MSDEEDNSIDREVGVNLNAESGYVMVIKASGNVIIATGKLGEALLSREDNNCCIAQDCC